MAIVGVPQTAARDTQRQNGEILAYKMKASTTIYKGGLVGLDINGLLVPWSDAANISFAGVAYETMISDGVNPLYCRVEKVGVFLVKPATGNSFTQAMVGQEVYVNSDNQVTTSTGDVTNAVKCGRIAKFITATSASIRINGYC